MQVLRIARSFFVLNATTFSHLSSLSSPHSSLAPAVCRSAAHSLSTSDPSRFFNGSIVGFELIEQQHSVTASSDLVDRQLCGRGDKRTKKGKRFKGSFGNSRHKKDWQTRRLREKWEMPAVPPTGSLLARPFPPLLSQY